MNKVCKTIESGGITHINVRIINNVANFQAPGAYVMSYIYFMYFNISNSHNSQSNIFNPPQDVGWIGMKLALLLLQNQEKGLVPWLLLHAKKSCMGKLAFQKAGGKRRLMT